MKIAFYSTDWTRDRIKDDIKSALAGKTVFVPNKVQMTFGGTYYYRLAMPGMELTKHGYDNFLSYQMDAAPDGHIRAMDTQGNWHDDCDAIVFQRWMGRNGAEVAKKAISTGQVIINDVDDNFWALTKTNVAYEGTDPKTHPEFNRDHYRKMLAASSAITVSTEPLRRELERLGPPIHVLRNAIDIDRWPIIDPGDTANPGMIGWVGGIQWRAHDLQCLKPVLPDFLTDHGIPFYHGGDSQVEGVPKAWEQIGIDTTLVRCSSAPICNISRYPELWQPISLALVPLEQCRFNEAKSYLKALEASACGIPYIVSDMEEQRILINEGGAGRIVRYNRPQQWRNHLEDLLDPELRRLEGKKNRMVAEQHNIAERWKDWDACYREVIG